ncbi:hypothetical protein BH24ACT26_BH24ACT26_13060 [soil metagenome]
MTISPLEKDILGDLLRSAWLVERARAAVFDAWAQQSDRFRAFGDLAHRRAEIVLASLRRHGKRPDEALVAGHAGWMQACVPGPQEPFADLFLARLAGWVDAHATTYLGDDAAAMLALGERERSALEFPSEVPQPPPLAPLEHPSVAVPDEALTRIGVLGDLHIGSRLGEMMAEAAIADLNASGADFVVQLGDITDHGEEQEFARAAALLGRLEMPWETMIGNHDAYSATEERLTGRERFTRWFGREPEGLLVEHRGVRLALLDSVEHWVSPFPPYDLITGAFLEGRGGAVVRGALSAAQHDILADIAAPGSPPAFVFLHHPPQPFLAFPPILFGLNDVDSGRLHATCDSGNVWGIFAGHTHRNKRDPSFGATPVQEVGVPRDYPYGYALIDVGRDGYTYRLQQISDRHLVADAGSAVGMIQRRYAVSSTQELAFAWRKG